MLGIGGIVDGRDDTRSNPYESPIAGGDMANPEGRPKPNGFFRQPTAIEWLVIVGVLVVVVAMLLPPVEASRTDVLRKQSTNEIESE